VTGLLAGHLPAELGWCVGAAAALAGLLLLWRPLAALGRLALRTGLGMAALALLAPVGAWLGIPLGVNLLNGAVLGLLGVPGLGLLMMLNWVL
jgi:inhibitor of the pro-sigma K processing machinery